MRAFEQAVDGPDNRTRQLTSQLADVAKSNAPRFVDLVRRADLLVARGMDRDRAYRAALEAVAPGRVTHGPFFAPIGELLVVDDGERVVCHLCGQALMMLSTSHVRRHGWTAKQYREAVGLSRSTALCAPAVIAKRRELGLVRYQGNQRLRAGFAVGQQMARDGSLLDLFHAAQPAGSARPQTRVQLGARARTRDSAGPVRHRIAARLAAMGFAGDLSGYLHALPRPCTA